MKKALIKIFSSLFLIACLVCCLTACGGSDEDSNNNNANQNVHQHTFANEWSIDQTHHWKESTCLHPNTVVKVEHDFENNVCKDCGFERILPHEHTFASEWTNDQTHHWKASTCNHPETEQKIVHEFIDGVCECGYELVTEPSQPETPDQPSQPEVPEEPIIPDEPSQPEHEHTFATEWSYDEDYHWHASTCGHDDAIEYIEHEFVDGVCECGYELVVEPDVPVEPDEPEHEHTFASEWSSDETHHWYASTCNHPETEEKIAHEFVDGVCECGYELVTEPSQPETPDQPSQPEVPDEPIIPDEPEHEHTFATEWSYDEDYHWHASTCGHDDTIEYIEHVFENRVCVDCGQEYFSQGLEYELNEDGESYSVVGNGTFSGTDLVIPTTYNGKPVTMIGAGAFCGMFSAVCKEITTIKISEGIESIGALAFAYSPNLTKVEIPASVSSISEGLTLSFGVCQKLTSIEVAKGNQHYKSIDGDLYSEDGLRLIQYAIGKTEELFHLGAVDDVAANAFNGAINLTEILIDYGVEKIGEGAFYNCSNLIYVRLPITITSIGDNAFYGCESLQYTIKDGLKYLGTTDAWPSCDFLYLAGVEDTSITTANISDECRFIGSNAFSNCSMLTSVKIPNSVTNIGEGAFSNCYSLTSVKIPDSVTNIGGYAFSNCYSLASVKIPASVVNVGSSIFYNNEYINNYNLTVCCEVEGPLEGWSDTWADCGWDQMPQIEWGCPWNAYQSGWNADSYYHWKTPTCEHYYDEIEYIEHEFVDGVCECGYVKPHEHVYEESWTVDKAATKNSDGSKSRHCVDYETCGGKTDETVIPKWSSDGGWTPNA